MRDHVVPCLGLSGHSSTARLILRQVLLLTIVVGTGFSAYAEGVVCTKIFSQEAAPYITERVAKNKFVTDRHLLDYSKELHPDFKNKVESLRAEQHWVDLGAGKATAQIDLIKSFDDKSQAPFATAVAFKLDRWFAPRSYNGKLKVAEGAYELQPTAAWKKADLVTDVYGVLSYTGELGVALQKTFDMMTVGGELYILTLPYGTQIQRGENKLVLTEFLKTVPGIKVDGDNIQIKITKTHENIFVPSLRMVRYTDGGPPLRLFEIIP
ncbi:hypothetical protein B9G69_001060 [Bdellovibrio sp. SKB1291214]|uniref:hypothetical protein n=1 Tax=Bdellovibrio sp. SKB1291214 TaxID=1732569 RepID=UPI001C3CCCC5|nr:hypothetical protein [Bdellovibrio sp. SKB1291214]UYL09164.1 hypothetical protein B9G69_001060 [Bdellovibrio sp. SKB1291214]